MLATYILSLREGLEAALIIGIVLSAVSKIHRKDLVPPVWFGTLSAIGVSIITAALLTSFFGISLEEEVAWIFEGITMFIAACILTWMIFWMSRQAHSMKGKLENGVIQAATGHTTGKRAVFWLSFVAVVREGIELAIFIAAAFFAGSSDQMTNNTIQTSAGAILGLGTAILLGYTLFATTIRLDLRRFFQVTGILLILFAAGLVAHGVHEFNEAGWIPVIMEHVWDVNSIIDERSVTGQLLQTLFGYNGNPSLTEMIAYFVYIIAVSAFWKREIPVPARTTAGSHV